jgi:DNA-binding beta-propeller fold protein YncE
MESQTITVQQQGQPQSQLVSAVPLHGFTGTIAVSVSGLPTGVAMAPAAVPSFDPAHGSTGFSLQASLNAPIATTTVTVTATSGSIAHTGTFQVTVLAVAPFTIQTNPSSLNMTPASNSAVQILLTADPGTNPQVVVSIGDPYSLPYHGVTVFPPQGFVTASQPVSFDVLASLSAQPVQNSPIILTATDNAGNTSVMTLPLTVSVAFSSSTTPTRSTFARTDVSPVAIAYDPTRKLIFATIETLNEVAVFSSVDAHRVATIPVMYPTGVDVSADGSAVYVVSPFGPLISTIDPNTFTVVRQTQLPPGNNGFQVAALSNGGVLVTIVSSTTAVGPTFLWNPVADTFKPVTTTGVMLRTPDHTKVLFYDGGGTDSTPGIYDAVSGTTEPLPPACSGALMAISPDGNQLLVAGYSNAATVICDLKRGISGSLFLNFQPLYGTIFSLDGSRAYVFGDDFQGAQNVVAVIDTSDFQLEGLVPGQPFGTVPQFSGEFFTQYAIDETNMLFGPDGRAVAYLDLSSPGFLNLPVPGSAQVSPTLVSITQPTAVQLGAANLSSSFNYGVYFGAPPASPGTQPGTNLSVQNSNTISVTAPQATNPGPANVTLTRSDGFFEVLPDAVSYGPTVLAIDANAGSTAGGDSIEVIGYGFDGFDTSSIQVTIGGQPATVTQIEGDAIAQFPTERIHLTTPKGTPGLADLTVTTPRGSTTVPAGFQYLAAQIYPMTGALDDIVYDQTSQRLYITNQDHARIEVFDLTSKSYLSPVTVGNQPTTLALTPDATELAVVNSADNTVSVVDLSTMQVGATYTVVNPADCGTAALSVTPIAAHRMFVDLSCTALADTGVLHILNLDTGSLSCSGVPTCSNGSITFFSGLVSMASTPDGNYAFFADQIFGGNALFNAKANTFITGPASPVLDSATDTDANAFAGQLGIFNQKLSPVSFVVSGPYSASGSNDVPGEKLNASGSLLYRPLTTGVEILDVHTGRRVLDVAVPEPIPPDSGALAIDETGTRMFLISKTGVTIEQFEQAPLSLGSAIPSMAASGTQITLRGSGFQNGATAKFGNSQATTTYVDQNTLKATVPALSPGPTRVTVTNPNGATYIYDALITIQ